MNLRPMSVSEINNYIGRQLKFDPILNNAIVVGEISNLKQYASGHMYFTLKDENSKLSCVMFKSNVSRLNYQPSEGEKTEIHGAIGVYERDGKYQLYAEEMAPVGEGELYKAFIKQKDLLEKSGYFIKHQQIRRFPESIGIVTSKTSAAVRDMLKVLKRRNPKVKVVVFHASVQGLKAANEIARGLDYFNETKSVDTIIVGRGGGSLEELWAFNEMPVVEAVFASEIPVISGIGHETDFTLTDFVADHRGATPTEAAELSVYPLEEYSLQLQMMKTKLINNMSYMTMLKRTQLNRYDELYLCQLIQHRLNGQYTNIDSLWNILHNNIVRLIESQNERLVRQGEKLHAISPLNTLNRGYGVVTKANKSIKDISEIEVSDRIDIIIKNGIIKTEVISKERKDFNEQ